MEKPVRALPPWLLDTLSPKQLGKLCVSHAGAWTQSGSQVTSFLVKMSLYHSQAGRQAGLLSLKGPLRTNGCSSPFSAPVCFAVHVSVCHVRVPVRAESHRAEGAVGPSELKSQGEHCLSLNVMGTRPGAPEERLVLLTGILKTWYNNREITHS